jgi:segregation and condensation protein A
MENTYNFKTDEKLSSYPVKLEVFEGPLDLLLFLIRKNEIDIYDIPISLVTQQYLEYLEMIRSLDLEVAGEFVLMAATLIRIKAQMLLPKTDEVETDEDPRAQLVAALLEYKKFKELSGVLQQKEKEESRFFPRSDFSYLELNDGRNDEVEVSLYDLLNAFKKVWRSAPKEVIHRVKIEEVSLNQRIEHILNYLKNRDKVKFAELFLDNPIKLVMVVTFIAILELIRLRKIKIVQRRNFSQIWIYRNSQGR